MSETLSEGNYAFIIDLDGTIIGDCIYQTEIYKIYLILGKLGIKIKINEILEPHYSEKGKLIRPHFSYFIKKMKDAFPNSHFYIYTASEKKWDEKEISLIEKNLKIKFNRPIFTRNDCEPTKDENGKLSYIKSINRIKRKIKLDNPEIIIIDDKQVYIDNNNRLIKCKLYNYKYFCNYWEFIPIEKIKNQVFIKYLSSLIEAHRLNPTYIIHNMKQKLDYYKWLYKKCKEINHHNAQYKNDEFWLNLTKIICKYKICNFSEKSVSFIQRSVSNHSTGGVQRVQ